MDNQKIKFGRKYFFDHFSFILNKISIVRFLFFDLFLLVLFFYFSSVFSILDFLGFLLLVSFFLLLFLILAAIFSSLARIFFYILYFFIFSLVLWFISSFIIVSWIKFFLLISLFFFIPYILLSSEYQKNRYITYFFKYHLSRILKFFGIRRFRIFRYYLFVTSSLFRLFHKTLLLLFDRSLKLLFTNLKHYIWLFIPSLFYNSVLIFVNLKIKVFNRVSNHFSNKSNLYISFSLYFSVILTFLDVSLSNFLHFIVKFNFIFVLLNFFLKKKLSNFSNVQFNFYNVFLISLLKNLDSYSFKLFRIFNFFFNYLLLSLIFFYSWFVQLISFFSIKKILKVFFYFIFFLFILFNFNFFSLGFLEISYMFFVYFLNIWHLLSNPSFLEILSDNRSFPNTIYVIYSVIIVFGSSLLGDFVTPFFSFFFEPFSWFIYILCKFSWKLFFDVYLFIYQGFLFLIFSLFTFVNWSSNSFLDVFNPCFNVFFLDPFFIFENNFILSNFLICWEHLNLYISLLCSFRLDNIINFNFFNFSIFIKQMILYFWWLGEFIKLKIFLWYDFPGSSWNIFQENFEYYYRGNSTRTHLSIFSKTNWTYENNNIVPDFSTYEHFFIARQAPINPFFISSDLFSNQFLFKIESFFYHPYLILIFLYLILILIFIFFKEFRYFLGFAYQVTRYSPDYLLPLFFKKNLAYSVVPSNSFNRNRFLAFYRLFYTARSSIKRRNSLQTMLYSSWNDIYFFLKTIGCSKKEILLMKKFYFSKSNLKFWTLFNQVWLNFLKGSSQNSFDISKSSLKNFDFSFYDFNYNSTMAELDSSFHFPSSNFSYSLNDLQQFLKWVDWREYASLVKFHYDPAEFYVHGGLHDYSLNRYKNISWPQESFESFIQQNEQKYFNRVLIAFLLDSIYRREQKITKWSSSHGYLKSFWQNVPVHFNSQDLSWLPLDMDPDLVMFSDGRQPFQTSRRRYLGFFGKVTPKLFNFFKFLDNNIFFTSLPKWALNKDWFYAETFLFDDTNSYLPSPVSFDIYFILFFLFPSKFYISFIVSYWFSPVDFSLFTFIYSYFLFFNDFAHSFIFPVLTSFWDHLGSVYSINDRFSIRVASPKVRQYGILASDRFLFFPDFLEYGINRTSFANYVANSTTASFTKPFFARVGFFFQNGIFFNDFFNFLKSYLVVFCSSSLISLYSLVKFNFFYLLLFNFKLLFKFFLSFFFLKKNQI